VVHHADLRGDPPDLDRHAGAVTRVRAARRGSALGADARCRSAPGGPAHQARVPAPTADLPRIPTIRQLRSVSHAATGLAGTRTETGHGRPVHDRPVHGRPVHGRAAARDGTTTGVTVPETLSYAQLLAGLPAGGFTGNRQDHFAIPDDPRLFVEPQLQFTDTAAAPQLTLISARGATGKSSLAVNLAARKQVPLWDLGGERKAVSGHALQATLDLYAGGSGGFANVAAAPGNFLVIDGLDEGRLGVSGRSWTEFIQSLAELCATEQRLVLLGRTGIVEDVWTRLVEAGVPVNWLEISFFDPEKRIEYIDAKLTGTREITSPVYVQARDNVLRSLSQAVDSSLSDAFVGYAPVLDAVVPLLEDNINAVVRDFDPARSLGKRRVEVVKAILAALLVRDQQKLAKTVATLGLDPRTAFDPTEQMQWLKADLLGAAQPGLKWCPPSGPARDTYIEAARSLVGQHPFRDDNGWASPVFSAYIAYTSFADSQIRGELIGIGRQSSLLYDFVSSDGKDLILDESQFAALHMSLLASGQAGVDVDVSLLGADPESDTPRGVDTVAGAFSVSRGSAAEPVQAFELALSVPDQLAVLGSSSNLSITFPGTVRLGLSGQTNDLGPDLFIRCRSLTLDGDSVQVLRRTPRIAEQRDADADVILEVVTAFSCPSTLSSRPPPQSVQLRVPGEVALGYPWVDYRSPLDPYDAPADDRAVRFLNKLMNLTRGHGHTGLPGVFIMKFLGRQTLSRPQFDKALEVLTREGVVGVGNGMVFMMAYWWDIRFSGKQRDGTQTFADADPQWQRIAQLIAAEIA
jgi:hypothetical protein